RCPREQACDGSGCGGARADRRVCEWRCRHSRGPRTPAGKRPSAQSCRLGCRAHPLSRRGAGGAERRNQRHSTIRGREESMLTEQIAKSVGPAGIDLAYERRGNPADPAVLLIMGLGAQLVHWPTGFVDVLVAHGLHVIRFDNRDSGRSTHMGDAPTPDLAAALAGDLSSVSYTLSDMAADA